MAFNNAGIGSSGKYVAEEPEAQCAMLERWFAIPGVAEPVIAAHPIGRIARPEEIAQAVLFLSSAEAAFILGHALLVDGGFVIQ